MCLAKHRRVVVDEQVQARAGCTHTLRFTRLWGPASAYFLSSTSRSLSPSLPPLLHHPLLLHLLHKSPYVRSNGNPPTRTRHFSVPNIHPLLLPIANIPPPHEFGALLVYNVLGVGFALRG